MAAYDGSVDAGMQAPDAGHASRSLFQRRFMRRLSIGVKLWTSAVILTIPLVGLAIFYMNSLSSTLWFTQTEQRGCLLTQPLVEIAAAAGQRAVLAIALFNKGVGASPEIERLTRGIEERLAVVQKRDAEFGNAATHGQLKTLQQAWEALKNGKPASVADIASAHSAVSTAAGAMKSEAATDWQIILDPELVAYNLLDVSTSKLPDAQGFLNDARTGLQSLYVKGEYQAAAGIAEVESLTLLSDRLGGAHDETSGAAQGAADRPDLARRIGALGDGWYAKTSAWATQVRDELKSGHPREDAIRSLLDASALLPGTLAQDQVDTQKAADRALEIRRGGQAHSAYFALGGSVVAIILASLLLRALITRISGAVRRLLQISTAITSGNFSSRIDESGTDEFSRLFAGMSGMQRTLKKQIEAERVQAEENSRVRSALDKASTNLMIADADHSIVYVNESAQRLFRDAQADLRRDVPSLDAERLVGASVDVLQGVPSLQRGAIENLNGTHTDDTKIGGRWMRIVTNPVIATDGKRTGTVVEWHDRTQEAKAEEEVSAIVGQALDGHLESRVALEGKTGFIQALSKGLNELLDNMAAMVRQIKTAAEEVTRGADEISQGNANLSQRTEEQSSSLEETASSMEQMTSTVKQNADNAGQANQLATAARDQAEKGGAVVGKAVSAMTGINESSRKIADIIGVIDEIAFQTNLLALNAAVEAARAGEQGRGFAVVASEVRNLAGRSATAAKEIKELIQDSVRRVDEGSSLVSQSGQTLDQIVSAVKKVSDIIAEIAAASHEQSDGIEQVNKAVMQLDEMTQQNAALVEQASAASQSMADQARGLNELMARYQVAGVAGVRPTAAAHQATRPGNPEKRGAGRPWATARAKPAVKPEAGAGRPRTRAAAGGPTDADWQEF